MTDRFQSSNEMLEAIQKRLAAAGRAKAIETLDAILKFLVEGRRYAWAGIYLATEDAGVQQICSGTGVHGEKREGLTLDELNAEIVAPIRLGARTLGMIVVESGRDWRPARQERVLVQQAAKLVARYLTTDRAKPLLRKTRERIRESIAVQPHKAPQSARPVVRRAAAGERITR